MAPLGRPDHGLTKFAFLHRACDGGLGFGSQNLKVTNLGQFVSFRPLIGNLDPKKAQKGSKMGVSSSIKVIF